MNSVHLRGPIAVVHFSDQSIWGSCQTINRNLVKCYELAFGDRCQFFQMRRTFLGNFPEVAALAEKIYLAKPERIVFIDDPHPHPRRLIEILRTKFGADLPPICFHLYGDFLLVAPEWVKLQPALIGARCLFVGASPRHIEMVKPLIENSEDSMVLAPFPVDESAFRCDPVLREEVRKRYGLNKEDRLIVYTGRLTYQKNVLRLIREFQSYLWRSPKRVFLFFAGGLDHLGGAYEVSLPHPGQFYSDLTQLLSATPELWRDRIRYLGALNASALNELYNASDLFASLSTYQDEDFGMSPAEALLCGNRALLSDWGGYTGFQGKTQEVEFVQVRIDESGLFMRSEEIQKGFDRAMKHLDLDDLSKLETRKSRSHAFSQRFSLRAVTSRLQEIHRQEYPHFWGFSSLMPELASRVRDFQSGVSPIFYEGMTKGTFYHRIYDKYFENPSEPRSSNPSRSTRKTKPKRLRAAAPLKRELARSSHRDL